MNWQGAATPRERPDSSPRSASAVTFAFHGDSKPCQRDVRSVLGRGATILGMATAMRPPAATQGAGPDGTAYLQGYSQDLVLTTLLICAPFTGFTLPLLEEYYFRGFLLPRLPQLGKWAPFFNTFFFSVYHFWAPWTVMSKLVFLYPGVWLAWKKQDIRISIAMHPGSALLMTMVGVIALASGAYSM